MSPTRLTESLLSDIVKISADAVICLDADHKITLFNEGAEHIFGWRSEEVIGQTLDQLLPKRARRVHDAHIEGFRASTDGSRRMGQRREISGVRKNGQEFPAEAAIAKVHVGDEVVYSVVLRDITEQVALQKRLQRAVVARDDTVGMVAHDLRNPLSAIKMLSASLLSDENALSKPVAESLELIRSAAQQMDDLIQDLLDVTRVEAGRLRVDMKVIAASELVELALTTLRPLLNNAGLRLSVDTGPALNVMADAQRIGQVMSNLVGNAIKFTLSGGTLRIAVTRADGAACIAVSDTGCGIAPERLSSVFDRFWQMPDAAIRSRGAGLGLPIARGIVLAHGGKIWAESEPDRGSTFYFTLPLAN